MKALEFLRNPLDAPPPVALLLGEESYFRDLAAARLIDGAEEDVDAFEGPGPGADLPFDLASFLDALRTPSMFGGGRIVRVRRAEKLISDHGETLARFIARGEAVHRLIVEAETSAPKEKPGAPSKSAKTSKSKASATAALVEAVNGAGGVVVACDALYATTFRGPAWNSDLTRWVVDEAKSLGKSLRAEDAYRLHQLAGTGLRELRSELEKLAVFLGPKSRIDAADVERMVGGSRSSPAYDFGDALAAADLHLALKLSQELFERGVEDPGGKRVVEPTGVAMMMLSAATTRLRKVAAAVQAMRAGASFEDAAGEVGVTPFLRDRFRTQVEAWRRRDPRAAAASLVALERGLKGGGGPPRTLVDRMVATLLLKDGAL